MAYRTFNIDGKEVTLHDLQDKGPWCITGASFEEVFVHKYPSLGLIINPEKKTNIYAPDLYNKINGNLADLKTQNTPFFLALSKYGISPQYAITFNKKDFLRYIEFYRGIEIYFWVDWQTIRFVGYKEIIVLPMTGVWKLTFENMIKAVSEAPIHSYVQRVNDYKGNAKDSYLLDLKSNYFEKVV